MADDSEQKITIATSDTGQIVLTQLTEAKVFKEEMDAYRFAIGLGLVLNKRTPLSSRKTKFNIGSFDKDRTVASLISALMPEAASDAYRAAEELAETGFAKMLPTVSTGEFRFSDWFDLAKSKK
jgi:hypothetical protein